MKCYPAVNMWYLKLKGKFNLPCNPCEFRKGLLVYVNMSNALNLQNLIAKAGTFLPFGAGSRLCPGNDLAMLEIAIFLHHFLLNYE